MITNTTAAMGVKWKSSPWRLVLICLWMGYVGNLLARQYLKLPTDHDPAWLQESLLTAAGFAIGALVNLVLHEMGHACVVRLLGCPIHVIELGTGKNVAQFTWAGFPFLLRSAPSSGVVRWGPTSYKYARLQRAAVTAGGMSVTMLIFLGTLAVLPVLASTGRATDSESRILSFWSGVVISGFVMVGGSWLPYVFKRDGRSLPTDILSLFRLPWTSQETLAEQVRRTLMMVQTKKLMEPSIKSADAAIAHAAAFPQSLNAQFTACAQLHAKGDPRAMDYARACVHLVKPGVDERKLVVDYLLTCGLDFDLLKVEPNGRSLLQESYDLDRVGIGNWSLYGAGLVDFGEDAEGEKFLEEAVKRAKFPVNLTYAHLFLAILARKKGLTQIARFHAQKAASLYPQCPGLKRVADLLEPAERRS